MNIRIVLFLILLFSTQFSFSQSDSLQKKKDLPYILFEKTTHDLGKLDFGSEVVYEFVFKNVGKQPLIIFNCQSSCDCTVSDCPKDPIKRNETGKVKVKYKATSSGYFSKSITVQSNALNNVVVLIIKGKVKDENKLNQ